MTRGRRLGIAVIAAAVGVTTFAAAATRTIHDPKHDLYTTMLPSGVNQADVDITKATVGRANGKIELTMTVDGSIKHALSTYDTSPTFSIKGPGPTFYSVSPSSSQTGYSVFNNTTPDPTPPSAKVAKPNTHTLALSFRPKAIGSPAAYHWRAVIGPCITYDAAPDTGFTHSKRC